MLKKVVLLSLVLSVQITHTNQEFTCSTQEMNIIKKNAQDWVTTHVQPLDPTSIQLLANKLYFKYAKLVLNIAKHKKTYELLSTFWNNDLLSDHYEKQDELCDAMYSALTSIKGINHIKKSISQSYKACKEHIQVHYDKSEFDNECYCECEEEEEETEPSFTART